MLRSRTSEAPATDEPDALARRYREVRAATRALAAPLSAEDMVVQSMPDCSPVKWHLAHTTWFFDQFALGVREDGAVGKESARRLFNSYYNAVGERYPRDSRGLLTRPSLEDVLRYRDEVNALLGELLDSGAHAQDPGLAESIEIGVQHEQQHQELLLMDVKHLLSCNPLRPAYRADLPARDGAEAPPMRWIGFEGGVVPIGREGGGFAYDNEGPRHEALLTDYALASRLVTNAEYANFIRDGGYECAELWLDDGWAIVQRERWRAPLYWNAQGDGWRVFTLSGEGALAAHEPVCHVSYYEADAFARWAAARLPTEQEWEAGVYGAPIEGNFVESGALHPATGVESGESLLQAYGDTWEWTRSAYAAYPGYAPAPGAIGEYNAKFMCNQFVLRGGCCVTPRSHVRATYRNFFHPEKRWAFAGIRLARDAR